MPTISEHNEVYTVIVVFTVAPEHQRALVEAIVPEVERWVRHCAGFISSSFHLSNDGTRVVNYAQWTTKEAWQAFTRSPEQAVLGERIKNAGKGASPDAHGYSVYRVLENADDAQR